MRISKKSVRTRPASKRRRKLTGMALILIGLIILAVFLDGSIRPIIEDVTGNEARLIATRIVNDSASEVLANLGLTYDELVFTESDQDGKIISLKTDVVKINILKSKISSGVAEAIKAADSGDFSIPMGTLFGSEFLMGRGPKIKLKLEYSGAVTSEIINDFSDAGINQTRHQIMMKINVRILSIIPGHRTFTEVNTNFLLAETVLVGAVPEAFTNVDGSGLSRIIADYGATAP